MAQGPHFKEGIASSYVLCKISTKAVLTSAFKIISFLVYQIVQRYQIAPITSVYIVL